MPPRRRHKVAATKETQPTLLRPDSQVPTPDPALEGIDPTQKQQIGSLTMLAEAAEAALLLRSSQRPGPQREPPPFDDDDFLRDFSPITDCEQSVVHETVPPLTIRTSPAIPKPNKFTNIAREIVGNQAPIEEEEEQEERPEVNFFAAAYIGKEKAPCYSKIIDNIWEFRLFNWAQKAVDAAELKWSAKGFSIEKGAMTATITAKSTRPSPLTLSNGEDWQACLRELERLNRKGASSIRVELRLQLEAVERPDEPEELTSSFGSDSDPFTFVPSRKRGKTTPASSKKNGNSKIDKMLAQERSHRKIDKTELNHVSKLLELHECVASSCRNNTMPCVKVGEEHVKLNHEQVGAWSRAINKGKATMEKPHARLQLRIEEQAAEQAKAREAKNTQKKKQRKERSDNEDSSASSTRKRRRRRRHRSHSKDRLPIIVQMPPQYYQAPPPVMTQPVTTPHPSAGPAPQSSPIRTACNANTLMQRYIDWLKKEKEEKAQKYDEAMTILLKEDIEVPHLLADKKGITRSQLQGLGLTMGIAIDVKEGVKTFRILHPNLFNGSPEAGDASQPTSPSN
jgi:hypothetical protein